VKAGTLAAPANDRSKSDWRDEDPRFRPILRRDGIVGEHSLTISSRISKATDRLNPAEGWAKTQQKGE
jgi:hypothetical protein